MSRSEDGQFELILGNRQLLSVFFIVVVLLGVFFTMGYIVGRNSGPVTTADAASRKEGKPLVVDSAAPLEQPAPTTSPVPESLPPKEAPAPEPPKAVQAEKKEEPKPAPVPVVASGDSPAQGKNYLQLAATTQREADIEVDVLRKKGFKALAAAIPEKPGTVRVLVGPIPEGGLNKMRSDLQAAGFPGDKAIRRTF